MLVTLPADFFAQNRRRLMENLPPDAVVILSAHRLMQERRDLSFPFTQEPNFYYLTGITEPDWKLVIDGRKKTSWLISPRLSADTHLFDGSLDNTTAKQLSGVDRVVKTNVFSMYLKDIAKSHTQIYSLHQQTSLARMFHMALNPAPRLLIRQLKAYGITALDCRMELSRLRAIKQPAELKVIQSAIDVTGEALVHLFEQKNDYRNECEYEAELTHQFRRLGSEGHAFAPIVAGGQRACTMHYCANNQKLAKKDWLLFDVGARVAGYSADLSRTVPLNKKPSSYELAVFDAVESVHDASIAVCQPGVPLMQYVYESDRLMMQALKDLGLIKRRSNRNLRKYYNHAIGHAIGLDTHESFGGFDTFQEGMVITVEPGIYDVEKSLGIRTENMFVITKSGPKILSAHIPNRLW